ncbi:MULTISPECIES: ABC transporter substrate-binding protein [Brachybacterium]|uniref:Multiple sugar transport system substrate-binding protein n=1 Tax=Brachybacterium fresconis TaxID=173363 RepID=A0ABS4YNJ0_9MICO|nr:MULTISPECIES: sugar ABC transporter substrate-binding protein [Brachybacterium]MBP2410356.1 multiple sugar transport system substrate-binding protein [Brachybacterium fresconis]MDN5688476.1 sugar ABC transporter substrate-binding protein [Brachybacterium sp.]
MRTHPFSGSPGPGRPGGPRRRDLLRAGGATLGGVGGASALAGCSTGGAGSSDPMQFWQFYAPVAQQDPNLQAQSEWFLSRIKGWEEAGGHSIDPVYIPGYTDPTNTRLITAFASGAGPDIFLISPGDFLRYYNGGVLEDLTPYMEQEAIDDFYPQALATRTVDDRIYGLPMEQEPLAIFYDVAAFEEQGLSEGDLPTTWEQMLELGQTMTGGERAGLVLETLPGYYQNFTFYPWLWQTGADVIDAASQRPIFDSDGAIQALQLFQDAIRTGAAPRTRPANGDIVSAMTGGYAAMWQGGIFDVAALTQNAPDYDYGVFTLPAPSGADSVTCLGGWAWCVNARGRDPEAAARFTVEVMGSMSQESIDAGVAWNGVAKGNIAARASVTEAIGNDGAFENPILQQFRDEILPTGRAEPRFPPVIYKTVSNAIQATMLGGADAAEQAEVAQGALESYLETYEGGPLL